MAALNSIALIAALVALGAIPAAAQQMPAQRTLEELKE